MRVKEFTIQYTRPDTIKIYPLGDMHLGTKHCVEDSLRKKIDIIKNDPLAYWIDMGDSAEFIVPSDPRWDSGGISDWVEPDNLATSQVNHYCNLLDPIKSKCIGKLKGNHEDAIQHHNHDNVQKNICDNLGVTDLDYSCFIKFVFKRKNSATVNVVTSMFTHGAGGAITAGAKLTRLQRLMDNFEADIVAQGHTHDLIIYEKPYLTVDNTNKIKHKLRVGAMTGCWFGTYTQDVSSSYGERKNYPPTTLGCPCFEITPDKGMLRVVR